MTWDEVRTGLIDDRTARDTMTMFLSQGQSLPPLFKGAAFMFLNGMSLAQVRHLANLLLEVVDYLEKGDTPGLIAWMKVKKIPPPFLELIEKYANNNQVKIQ